MWWYDEPAAKVIKWTNKVRVLAATNINFRRAGIRRLARLMKQMSFSTYNIEKKDKEKNDSNTAVPKLKFNKKKM